MKSWIGLITLLGGLVLVDHPAVGQEPSFDLPPGTYLLDGYPSRGTASNITMTAMKNPKLVNLGGIPFLVGTVDARYASSFDRTEYAKKPVWVRFDTIIRFHRME